METAKCAHCGEDTGKAASLNWTIYCAKDACREAFMNDIMNTADKPKRSRKST